MKNPKEMEQDMEKRPSEQNPRSKNILLVDDERLILNCLARQLRGHRVFKAPDILSALGLLEEEEIDLVLADYRMPGGDGVTLLEIVRRRYPHVRRSMMSAEPPLNIGELIHAGIIEHYFPKPFGLSLVARVLDLLQEDPQAAQAEGAPSPASVEHNAPVQ